MEKKRLTVHGNEVTDGRFRMGNPEKDIELLRKGIQAGFKSLAYGNEPLRAGRAFRQLPLAG